MITVEEVRYNIEVAEPDKVILVRETNTSVVDAREVVSLTVFNSSLPAHTHVANDIEPTSIEWGQFETFLFS
jgi:hypothetical protein